MTSGSSSASSSSSTGSASTLQNYMSQLDVALSSHDSTSASTTSTSTVASAQAHVTRHVVTQPTYDRGMFELAIRNLMQTWCTKHNHSTNPNANTNITPAPWTPSSRTAMLFDVTCWAAKQKYLDESAPFQLLEDIFDVLPLSQCDAFLAFFRTRTSVLTSIHAFSVEQTSRPKLALLRVYSTLSRRLSRTTHTAMAGELLMLLANIMPLDERSGVNNQHLFHTENTTEIDSAVTESSVSPTVDYNLYTHLWALQNTLSNPQSLRFGATGTASSALDQSNSIQAFFKSLDTVLTAFEGVKLKHVEGRIHTSTFPKYLTSVDLLHLELHDPQFRRHVLIQCLILFHYLLNPTGVHDPSIPMSGKVPSTTPASIPPSQMTSVRQAQTRVLAALRATPPHGSSFTDNIQSLLSYELSWIGWKHHSRCAPMTTPSQDITPTLTLGIDFPNKKKRKMPTTIDPVTGLPVAAPTTGVRIPLGSLELSRLWSISSDNDAILSERRIDSKSVMDRNLETVKDEMNDTMLDEQDKLTQDKRFTWRTLRAVSYHDVEAFMRSDGVLPIKPDRLKPVPKFQTASTPAASPVSGPTSSPVTPSTSTSSSSTTATTTTTTTTTTTSTPVSAPLDGVDDDLDLNAEVDAALMEDDALETATATTATTGEADEERDGDEDDDSRRARKKAKVEPEPQPQAQSEQEQEQDEQTDKDKDKEAHSQDAEQSESRVRAGVGAAVVASTPRQDGSGDQVTQTNSMTDV